jgi:hypothetical protein
MILRGGSGPRPDIADCREQYGDEVLGLGFASWEAVVAEPDSSAPSGQATAWVSRRCDGTIIAAYVETYGDRFVPILGVGQPSARVLSLRPAGGY